MNAMQEVAESLVFLLENGLNFQCVHVSLDVFFDDVWSAGPLMMPKKVQRRFICQHIWQQQTHFLCRLEHSNDLFHLSAAEKCSAPEAIENAELIYLPQTSYDCGSVVKIQCHHNYVPRSTNSLKCLPSGEWDAREPCVKAGQCVDIWIGIAGNTFFC